MCLLCALRCNLEVGAESVTCSSHSFSLKDGTTAQFCLTPKLFGISLPSNPLTHRRPLCKHHPMPLFGAPWSLVLHGSRALWQYLPWGWGPDIMGSVKGDRQLEGIHVSKSFH